MTLNEALDALNAAADPARAAEMAAHHKMDRPYLGVTNPEINTLTTAWRQALDIDARVALADALWQTNIFEARLAAAKLLTQARMRPDEAAWELIQSWVPEFDSWAIADHACMAGQRRLLADPARLDQVELWTQSDNIWTRRAALVITLPWTKQNFPSEAEIAARERILGWAAEYVERKNGIIQKAVAWWLRDLSKHAPERTRAFLAEHGAQMKPYAVTEAQRNLPPVEEAPQE
ncbi:hypothetical protein P775_08065 [Puniceibacterium antarcticum]|uniref:DNA alkylation repair protein n=1 Tax=Puniceibacterium antarcticum TaxID=1206336 RepID=A0A2G8RFW9_9RHOB|nr:DNA alkylation repair protein [Puniceibacterium antarcticum]PIL20474.1 hypothetical protein P775_08065 [Puniceibacterium antarcticum]